MLEDCNISHRNELFCAYTLKITLVEATKGTSLENAKNLSTF